VIMSAGYGIRVTQSRLTGHWVVNHGSPSAEGFRRWTDAMAEAERRAERLREQRRRVAASTV